MRRKCSDCKKDISQRHYKCVRCKLCQIASLKRKAAAYQKLYLKKHKRYVIRREYDKAKFNERQSYMSQISQEEQQPKMSCVTCGQPAESELCEPCQESWDKFVQQNYA